MVKPVLATIAALEAVDTLNASDMLEMESVENGSGKTTVGDIASFTLAQALEVHYTKTEADLRFKGIDVRETWAQIEDKPNFIGAGESAEAARAAIGAGTSSLVIGIEEGTAAEGNDSRIVNAVQQDQIGVTVAGLDENQLIRPENLPSYVDDVLEFNDFDSFPAEGETGKIYIALDTHIQYRWGSTEYVQITIGEVTSVNGRKGVVIGLAEQADLIAGLAERYTKSEVDGKLEAIENGASGALAERYTKTESDGRYRQLVSTASRVYVTDSEGNQTSLEYSKDSLAGTIAQRDENGEMKVSPATVETSAATLSQLTDVDHALKLLINDRYTKDETYTSIEVNAMFDNLGNTLKGYSLPIVPTDGEMDLSEANIFLLNDIPGRAVSFINEPEDRSILTIIRIQGTTPVMWPDDIDWVLESTPILGSDYTLVNILKHGDVYIGQQSIAVNKSIE